MSGLAGAPASSRPARDPGMPGAPAIAAAQRRPLNNKGGRVRRKLDHYGRRPRAYAFLTNSSFSQRQLSRFYAHGSNRMTWIENNDYLGPDRRRLHGFRLIERRRCDCAQQPPSLGVLLRKLQFWASAIPEDTGGIDRYRARV